ncbi:hypothetical protein BDZ89DRAFT_1116951 [Hymenopellis radicata]|nr:hypothetical protein BDZ89DRAFT_1116951 [Hymenopellis radicata]
MARSPLLLHPLLYQGLVLPIGRLAAGAAHAGTTSSFCRHQRCTREGAWPPGRLYDNEGRGIDAAPWADAQRHSHPPSQGYCNDPRTIGRIFLQQQMAMSFIRIPLPHQQCHHSTHLFPPMPPVATTQKTRTTDSYKLANVNAPHSQSSPTFQHDAVTTTGSFTKTRRRSSILLSTFHWGSPCHHRTVFPRRTITVSANTALGGDDDDANTTSDNQDSNMLDKENPTRSPRRTLTRKSTIMPPRPTMRLRTRSKTGPSNTLDEGVVNEDAGTLYYENAPCQRGPQRGRHDQQRGPHTRRRDSHACHDKDIHPRRRGS